VSDLPRVEAHTPSTDRRWTIDPERSVAVLLCTFRLCDWHSPDVRTLGLVEQDDLVRWHLIDEHPVELRTLAGIAAAPPGVCARPHPSTPGRWCTELRRPHASHGDGHVDRWLLR
jgi:hypothetical protein